MIITDIIHRKYEEGVREMEDKQVLVISETLMEAIGHIKKLITEKNYTSIYQIFAMTIEGLQAIQPLLIQRNQKEEIATFERVEQSVILFAEYLEAQNELEMFRIIQFNLEPNIKKMNTLLSVKKNEKKEFRIGIYLDNKNPIDVTNQDRLKAMFKEAEQQNCQLYTFTSEDVDVENEVINARYSLEDKQTIEIPLPDAINNIMPTLFYAQSEVERWLRRKIPFTTFPIGNKLTLPEKMIKETNLGHLFIPFVYVSSMKLVYSFFKQYKKGVFKKTAAARGENIFFVQQRSKNRFVVEVNKKSILMDSEGFENWVTEYLLPDKFILQQYKEFQTIKKEPYDIRSHVQKNGEGKWEITKIYPRIGSKKSILSNISTGGRTDYLSGFLEEQFGEKVGINYEKELVSLSLEIAENIDRIYNFSIDELGLDLAIDQTGRIWMHEANPGPQSKYHEEERAKNTIAYARYLGENRMFLSNTIQESTGLTGQYSYNSKTDQLTDLDKNKITIGLLYDENSTHEKYLEACAIVAEYNNNNFVAFEAVDIDYNNKIIRVKMFENFEWKEKIVRYPDVIYDRLRMKHSSIYNLPYVEFKNMPFTHNLSVEDLNKIEISNRLSKYEEIAEQMIPYTKVEKLDELFEFIDIHQTVILKPIHGSFAVGIIKIEKDEKKFIWSEEGKKEYSHSQLKRILNERAVEKNYLVQKFIESKSIDGQPIDMRIHLIKTADGDWVIAKDYVRISNEGFKINTENYGNGRAFSGQIAYINRFLKRNFPDCHEELQKKIETTAHSIAKVFDQENNDKVSEQALDLALTLEGDIYLIEINANRPGIFGYEYEIARHMIPYASSLVK